MNLKIYQSCAVEKDEFINFWKGKYYYPKEALYTDNIRRPLTAQAVMALYEWKNGGKLSDRKRRSVQENYVQRIHELPDDHNTAPEQFLQTFQSDGPIWRIFWLHCWLPDKYPIFDQHVYRAMIFIRDGGIREIPVKDAQKVNAYLEDYLTFWNKFSDGIKNNDRRIDKALVTFGKFIKSYRSI